MWKDYSKSYMKNNRASSMSVMAAAFIASMFLSLLCSIAYNFWNYDIEKIILEEGDWQGRIVCENLSDDDLFMVRQFANVEKAVINKELSKPDQTVLDIYVQNAGTIYRDMPLISKQLRLNEPAVQYHSLLLSRYFIHDPTDDTPPMLLALYLAVLILVSVSLILIIRNSFELSMNARIHQLGILSSIGATPKQIRSCLLQEAMALGIPPMIPGSICGMLLSYGMIGAVNIFAADVSGRHEAVFHYHLFVFAVTILVSVCTVLLSAWMPARKLSRMTPLDAIRNTGSLVLYKRKHVSMLAFLFGIKGEIAANALKAQKKSLRISTLSLLLSLLGFSMMLCFTTLSAISTRYTYFERYQDAWDIMVTLKNTNLTDFHLIKELQHFSGIQDAAAYQKAEAVTLLPESLQSSALVSLGGLEEVADLPETEGRFQVTVPVIILDDESFLDYCAQIGVTPKLDGAIVYNQIWDSVNSNFRYPKYIPFIKEDNRTTTLYKNNQSKETEERAEMPVLSYTRTLPVLREEYEHYALVHVIPAAMWEKKIEPICEAEPDSYIRILSKEKASLADLNRLEKDISQLVSAEYHIESENRVQERIANDSLIDGMKVILGAFCVLLAVIGIANVFSNTLGFLRQRKREFAQYRSVGLTPLEMKHIFCIEAFVIAGKPLFITFPLTILFVQFMTAASYLDPMVFWKEAPVVPIVLFAAAIVLFVSLAYYMGGKRLLQCDLNETLRNDALN